MKKDNWIPAFTHPENSDITTWELPDGAIARLGQGIIMRAPAYSPCGMLKVQGYLVLIIFIL